jgi:hypothetical protein
VASGAACRNPYCIQSRIRHPTGHEETSWLASTGAETWWGVWFQPARMDVKNLWPVKSSSLQTRRDPTVHMDFEKGHTGHGW